MLAYRTPDARREPCRRRLLLLPTVLLALVFQAGQSAQAQLELVDLFTGVRIPNLVVTTDGTILAFAGQGSQLRRSEDGGKTWSPVQTVASKGGGSAIVDANTGDVMVVDSRTAQLWRSSDQGKSWQHEQIVVKPNAMGHGDPAGVPIQTACSESGITLQHGEHKGRLLMPARVQPPHGNNDQEWWPYNYNTAIYSDDGGQDVADQRPSAERDG